jgi:hypothetical protein
MAARTTSTRAKAQAPVEPEDGEDEFEEMESDEDLEELEEPEEAPAPAKRTRKTAAPKATADKKPASDAKGSAWLAAHVTEVTGETHDSRSVRMLLRKLAADGKLEREVGVSRDRYEFTGPNDPTVKAVVQLVKSGEAKAMKTAALDKLKTKAAETRAAKAKAKAEAEAEDDEMEDAEEEVPEEAPKPTRRRAAASTKPATPAKATASRRRSAASA